MFFKKKKEKLAEEIQPVKSKEELQEELEQLLNKLNNGEDVYNSLGKCYFELNEVDKAIDILELCLEKNKKLGSNYNDLMKYYNVKRKEAAIEKNDEKLQLYLNKIDTLMQLSKDVIRGKI